MLLLGASEEVLGWMVLFTGVLGLTQHANVAMPTPAWLDRLACTPAVHRLHHSRDRVEGDRDFATVLTPWDALFGTWLPPRAPFPDAIGVAGDEDRGGFVQQWLAPFRAPR